MQFKTITNRKLPFFVALGLIAALTSCGSYQYAGYDNDGIYASDDSDAEVEQPIVTTSTSDSNYYKNYFAENSAEVDAIKEESEIFTDVDSYEGNYTEQTQDSLEQRPAYGGWGQSNSTVTINYIDNGWGYDGWGFSSFGGWGYGWGYPPGYAWGYNAWGWGWGAGWGGGWGWGYPGYGYGYPGYGGYYGYNSLSYSNTRRGSMLYNDNLSRSGGARNSGLTRRNYASTGRNTAATRRNYSTTRLSNAASPRNTRVRSNSSTRSVNNNGVTRSTRTTRPSTSTRTTRPSSTNRSTRSTAPSRTSRSSGSARSTRSTRSSTSSARSSRSSSSRSSSSRSSSSSSGRKGRG